MSMLFRSPAAITVLLLGLGLSLAAASIGNDLALIMNPVGTDDESRRLLLVHSILPRFATALILGAALSLSGLLLQQALRNPLASPTTLGTSAGASLALAVVTLFFPALQGFGRDTIAIAGAALSALLVLALSRRQGTSPLAFILAGLMVGLWCSALSAVLVLMNDRYLAGLFIWGSGSLALQSWTVPLSLLPKVAACFMAAIALVRPLSLMELGDDSASAAGISVNRLRVTAMVIAVVLSAVATSAVGVIGFVGLVAPAIARLAGARLFRQQLLWSPLIGAGLLLLTDETVKMLSTAAGIFLPTGALTALFGAPFVLALLSRMRTERRNLPAATGSRAQRRHVSASGLMLIVLLSVAGVAIALLVGRAPGGQWEMLPPVEWFEILPYRWPRIIAALSAAAMLGCSGAILQRLTGNEMASPELIGMSAGATTGVAASLLIFGSASYLMQAGFAALGSFAVLAVVLALALRARFAPERVLLAGVVLTAMLDAIISVLAATGDPRAMSLLAWMAGSTYLVEPSMALASVACAAFLLVATLVLRRWLDLLPLGEAASRAVGIEVTRARGTLLILAALMAAAATVVVGPLSFVGLVGPHLARVLGLRGAWWQVAGSAMAAGLLMMAADWLGRMIAFPYQVPGGLIAVLMGAPLLVAILMSGGRGSSGRWQR